MTVRPIASTRVFSASDTTDLDVMRIVRCARRRLVRTKHLLLASVFGKHA